MAIGDNGATPALGAGIRETLAEKFAEAPQIEGLPQDTVTSPDRPDPPITAPDAPPAGETAEQKAGRLAGRARAPDGKLLPGKAAKPEAEPRAPKPDAGTPAAPAGAIQAPAVPAAPAIARPTSWKAEHLPAFDKLAADNPQLAQYLIQRETEMSRGIAKHNEEQKQVRPLIDAVQPFMAEIQQHGMNAPALIQNLLGAHKQLALGSEQQKLAMFQQLLPSYGIKAQLAVQGADGQWQLLAAQAYQPPQQQAQQQDPRQALRELLQEERMAQQIQEFTGNTEKHPHYEELRETMIGLLQSGIPSIQTLDDAYEAALQLPAHRHLFDAQQAQQREADEAARRAAEQQRVAGARAKAVSTPSATPGGPAQSGAANKPLRESIAEKVYAAGSGARL